MTDSASGAHIKAAFVCLAKVHREVTMVLWGSLALYAWDWCIKVACADFACRCFNRRCIRCLSASPGSHCGKGTFFCGNCMRVFGKKQHFSEEACWQAVKEGRAVDPDYKRGKS
jgi:hypothetical protein